MRRRYFPRLAGVLLLASGVTVDLRAAPAPAPAPAPASTAGPTSPVAAATGTATAPVALAATNTQHFASLAQARTFLDAVMARAAADDIIGGVQQLKPYMGIPSGEFDASVERIALMLPVASARYGPVVGTEFVTADTIGTSLGRVVYLLRHQRHVMIWTFGLYRTEAGWNVDTFNLNDNAWSVFPDLPTTPVYPASGAGAGAGPAARRD